MELNNCVFTTAKSGREERFGQYNAFKPLFGCCLFEGGSSVMIAPIVCGGFVLILNFLYST